MKSRIYVLAPLGLSLCLITGFAGCSDEAKVQQKETVSTPTGTTTTETTKKISSSGSNPPANSAGEKVDPKN